MRYVNLEEFLNKLTTNEIRVDDMKCEFFPDCVEKENHNIPSEGRHIRFNILYNHKQEINEYRRLVVFLNGKSSNIENQQFFPQAAYMAALHNSVCVIVQHNDFHRNGHPESVIDAMRTIDWMIQNAEKYILCPDKITLIGGYIGGSIAEIIGSNNEQMLKPLFRKTVSWKVQSIVCLGTPFDFDACLLDCEAKERILNYIGECYGKPHFPAYSPKDYYNRGNGEMLFINARDDKLVRFGHFLKCIDYTEETRVESVVYPIGGHGWFNNFPYLKDVLIDMVNFIYSKKTFI